MSDVEMVAKNTENIINDSMEMSEPIEIKEEKQSRTILISSFDDENPNIEFCSNAVKTSKYTWWSIIPKNLLEQFRRIANIYFLVISLLQVSTTLSPTSPYATIVPLALVLFATMVKEAFEDRKRHKADKRTNESPCSVVRNGIETPVKWEDVKVGDIILVKNKQLVPADLVILSTSGEQGICYIETVNLDGETNLKLRQSLHDTLGFNKPELFGRFLDEDAHLIECEAPNSDLYTFSGSLHFRQKKIPIGKENVIWRGASVMNTDEVYGIVVYTGPDAKISLNSSDTPSKFSLVDRLVNRSIVLVFVTLAILCTVSTILHAYWLTDYRDAWFVPFLKTQSELQTAQTWVTFLILYNNLVPISLYVSLELVKLLQARLIESDLLMYHADSDTPALARTSNLNEDLGQIQYIFSDKTGTLTVNQMDFKMCSVGGQMYGHEPESTPHARNGSVGQIGSINSHAQGGEEKDADFEATQPLNDHAQLQRGPSVAQPSAEKSGITGYEFDDEKFRRDLQDKERGPAMNDFLLVMGLCHTVLPETDKDSPSGIRYKASSPDENALVTASRELGHRFFSRVDTRCKMEIDGEVQEFQVLNINEFTSTRKRMSVVARNETGVLMLLVKGADDVIIQNLKHKGTPDEDILLGHLKHFGNLGLRTLVMAKKTLDEDEYEEWNQKFVKASNEVHDRDKKLHDIAVELETDLTLVGASAIEDKLQDGVPEAIANLAQAGIKIWMLTGDKLETAINIGYSCHLLNTKMTLLHIDQNTNDKVNQALRTYLSQNKKNIGDEDVETLSMIISGSALKFIFEDPEDKNEMRRIFLQLCIMCKAVVACRLNPKQKAEIVSLVKNSVENQPMTLAIGDGANDVSMIQEAHIGVGISGNEGMQAVRSSDYALAQFRYITRLLLVHGRWNYRRICIVILYSFYKNITNVFTLFYYGFETGFTGTTLYESYLGAAWNVAFTLLPIIFYGVLEQDIGAITSQQNPRSYKRGQKRLDFNVRKMMLWVATAVVHSIIIYFLASKILSNPETGGILSKSGVITDSLFLGGTIINFVCVITVNLKLALHTLYWTKMTSLFAFLTLMSWFVFVGAYSEMISISFDFFGASVAIETSVFWLSILVVPFTAVLVDICILFMYRFYFPTEEHVLRELEHNARLKDPLNPQMDFRRASVLARTVPEIKSKDQKVYHDQPALQTHIRHLKHVLRDQKTKPLSKALRTLGNAYDSKNIHLLTLEFTGEAKKFETSFRIAYVAKNIRSVRVSCVIMFIFLLIYTIYSFFGEEVTWPERAVATFIAGPLALMFIFSAQFRKYYFGFQFWALLITGVIQVKLIDERGVNGMALFAIVVFLVFRSRFPLSCFVVVLNFIAYVVFKIIVDQSVSGISAVQILFLHICIMSFAASGAYSFERAFRRDFLLQKETQAEKERTQIILRNMLPEHISKKLNQKSSRKKTLHVAERANISIMFVDIMGFSGILDSHTPQKLVGLLDALYSTLDEICPRFGMQKMETVGKTYMACAGLEGSAREHARAAVMMSQEVISILSHCTDVQGNPVKVRCGVHTGDVIAGVVGKTRPQFSLFGDTINVASRMQSTGLEMSIHISQYTHKHIRNEFHFEPLRTFVKGKCVPNDESTYMRTYIVGRRRRQMQRKLSIIHPTKNASERDEEIKELILTRDERAKVDPFDKMKDTARLNKLTLQFDKDNLELAYTQHRSKKLGKAVRTPVIIMCLFFAAEAIFEFVRSQDSDPSVIVFIFAVRYSFCLLCLLFIYMSKQQMFSERGTWYTVALFLIAVATSCVASIVVVPPEDNDKGSRLTLIIILLMTLVSNAGALQITMVLAVDLISVILWMIADFGFAVNGLGIAYHGLGDSFYNLFWIFVAALVNAIAAYAREMYLRREFVLVKVVKDAKENADAFLYSMLPTSIATELKEGNTGISDQFENVTILYSDIKGFTTLASKSEPQDVILLLSRLFTAFDNLTDTHTVYKVQTIGDAYVVISGFPFQSKNISYKGEDDLKTQNCVRCVQFARGMQKEIAKIRTHDREKIQMRIGIHTGTIVAGCIGTKALRYDIWGTDCLVGNKFESEGIPGMICVSETSRSILRDKFEMVEQEETFEVRGTVYRKWIIDPDVLHPIDEDLNYMSQHRYAKRNRGDLLVQSRNQKQWQDSMEKDKRMPLRRNLTADMEDSKDSDTDYESELRQYQSTS